MKHLSIYLLVMAGLIIYPAVTFSQNSSDSFKPQWMHKLPVPTNSTFIYKIISASSLSLEDARKQTIMDLIDEVGMKGGVAIISDHTSKERVSQVWENGKLTEKVTNDLETNTSAKSSEMTLHADNIDEYWTQDVSGTYHLSTLYALSELGVMPLYYNIEYNDYYYDEPVTWGLSLIPGAAQMHKGSYLKGGLIMGGSVALAAGATLCSLTRQDYLAKMANTHSAATKQQYVTKSNNLNTGMWTCVGCLAALYVYNIVDAFVAPGARRIIVTPAVSPEGQYGVSVTYNF